MTGIIENDKSNHRIKSFMQMDVQQWNRNRGCCLAEQLVPLSREIGVHKNQAAYLLHKGSNSQRGASIPHLSLPLQEPE